MGVIHKHSNKKKIDFKIVKIVFVLDVDSCNFDMMATFISRDTKFVLLCLLGDAYTFSAVTRMLALYLESAGIYRFYSAEKSLQCLH